VATSYTISKDVAPTFGCPFEWHELGRQSCGRFLLPAESIRFVMFS
jgi:hypothetical protein